MSLDLSTIRAALVDAAAACDRVAEGTVDRVEARHLADAAQLASDAVTLVELAEHRRTLIGGTP